MNEPHTAILSRYGGYEVWGGYTHNTDGDVLYRRLVGHTQTFEMAVALAQMWRDSPKTHTDEHAF